MNVEFSECAGMEVEVGTTTDHLGESLGEGAEGAVYELEKFKDVVAKIFKKDKRENKREKIEAMLQESMISPEDQTDIPWTAWPVDPVSHPSDGSFLGYVMPYLDTDEHIDAQRYASQNLKWEHSSQRQRFKPAINLVLTIYWLHQNGYAIGDLSEQNVRVNDGNVTLIDCDSYSIKGSEFTGQMEAPRYTPPEGRGTSHEEIKQTDQFGVTVHIFQFLMAGFHPYQAVGEDAVEGSLPQAIERGDFPYGRSRARDLAPPPQAPDFSRLPRSVRRGFKQCFSTGQSDPSARPSLEKWLAILSKEGDFDIGGIDLSEVTIEDAGEERLGRNWQEEIRQRSDRKPTSSTAGAKTTQTATTTTSSPGETHWADEFREEQTTGSGDGPSRQPTTQQSTTQQSTAQQSTAQQSTAQQSSSIGRGEAPSSGDIFLGIVLILLLFIGIILLII